MESNILLESGTNELEVLEFVVGEQSFGINIAKVTEIMQYRPVIPVPDSPPEFEGVFTPRDKVISVLNLHTVLHKTSSDPERDLLIICHFNNMDVGFHVSSVKGIQRISWEDIEKPPAISGDGTNNIATGIAKFKDRIILILDVEKIVCDINRTAVIDTQGMGSVSTENSTKHIVIAEDSPFLNKLIVDALNEAGFKNVVSFDNGSDAWEYISAHKSLGSNIRSEIACLISDIEMPKMDGHRLTKLIKDDEVLQNIPVYLFSSLINEQMRVKGESVGADAQFSKPQIANLINYVNDNI
ncbi:MAG: chemotaxis protein CheV [Oscillospiraceae bacterium]|nr:chemotaxis protein CheV [Oscillospiraceae bacterium]